ncbi:MAG: CopG family transcriptional regulator [Thermoprotei archaeon]
MVSFKVPRELKEKMKKYKHINWSAELRKCLENRIREIEAEENLRRVVEKLSKIDLSSPPGYAVKLLREDRESH